MPAEGATGRGGKNTEDSLWAGAELKLNLKPVFGSLMVRNVETVLTFYSVLYIV